MIDDELKKKIAIIHLRAKLIQAKYKNIPELEEEDRQLVELKVQRINKALVSLLEDFEDITLAEKSEPNF